MREISRKMALDVGDARIGVAISDPLGMFAQPLCTVERNKKNFIEKLLEIIKEKKISEIIIGMPYEMSGNLGEQAEKVKKFSEKLKNSLSNEEEFNSIEVKFWDERLTTKQAQKITAGSGLKNKDCAAALDRVSAALILDAYLNSQIL